MAQEPLKSRSGQQNATAFRAEKTRDAPQTYFWRLSRWRFGITNFSPDQVSSMAQTLMSTRPSGNARSRTTTSLRSVATPEAFFGQDTQIMPSGAIASR